MKIAAITYELHIADCKYNADRIIEEAKSAYESGCDLAVFPAFAVSGCSCGNLFKTGNMRVSVKDALVQIKNASAGFLGMTMAVGFPISDNSCIALFCEGEVLGIISHKQKLTFEIDGVLSETKYPSDVVTEISGTRCAFIPASKNGDIEFSDSQITGLTENVPAECDHVFFLWSGELYAGSIYEYLKEFTAFSQEYSQTFISVSSGPGESADECVYSGLKSIVRGGHVIEYTCKTGLWTFEYDPVSGDDLSEHPVLDGENLRSVYGFMPSDESLRRIYCLDIMKIQAVALGERLKYLNMDTVVLGLSGGLDSTLALVAAVNAFDMYGFDRKNIICVTMPGFGTGKRTKGNAEKIANYFGVTLITIDIKEQVSSHLHSIGQPVKADGIFVSDVTFENAQARTRTMILMDMANKEKAIVIGTGDMSELALGWCTYNGDHMSNFSVNAGIPKTVIAPVLRTYVEYVADRKDRDNLSKIIEDIIDTPVSPELLPAGNDGGIVQKTEDSLGPYALHDFFLYHFLYFRDVTIDYIFEKALNEYNDIYDQNTIYETFKTFIKRFFSQQFKRSCMPVGPKAYRYSLSPRSGFLFPGDAYANAWLKELEEAKKHTI